MRREAQNPIHKLTDLISRRSATEPQPSKDEGPRDQATVVAFQDYAFTTTAEWFDEVLQKITHDQLLSLEQWEVLLDWARVAYHRAGHHQQDFCTEPLSAIMRAFRAFLTLRNNTYPDRTFSTDGRYICLFASFLDRPEITHSNSWKVNATDLLTDVIEQLESTKIVRVNASFLVDLFLGALVEEPPVDNLRLNQALAPYTVSIFRAAARGYALNRERPGTWVLDLVESRSQPGEPSPSRYGDPVDFEHNSIRLQVLPNSHDTGAILTLRDGTVRVALGTIRLHRWADVFCRGVVANDFTPSDDGLIVNLGAVQIDLTADDAQSLRHLFGEYEQSHALSEQRDRTFLYWGRI